VLAGLTGCGATGSTAADADETLLLDSQPNGVHAGIYLAAERGYDEAEGVNLTIQRPSPSTDARRLLQSGRADAAVLAIHDLGLARERGAELVGVMALVQRPRALVLAVTRNTLTDRRPEVAAVVRALQRGYSEAQTDPESAVQAIVAREDGLDPSALAAELDAVAPAFTAGVPEFGFLERARLRAWAARDRRNGILKKPLDVDLAFDTSLVRPISRD
jgi:ABC-type nitrate/sulfonate/bicarbonate transport system substrate-binding protein